MPLPVITKEFKFTLEGDHSLPPEMQTEFYIVPHTAEVTDQITTMFANARKQRARKGDQYDDAKWTAARVDAFCLTVHRVCKFPIPHTEDIDHDQVRVLVPKDAEYSFEYQGFKWYIVPEVTTRPQLAALARLMKGSDIDEISEAADQKSSLSDVEKKS